MVGMIWPEDRHLHTRTPREIELACPSCGHCWYADGHLEYGWGVPDSEDDAICPACGGPEGEAA